MNHRTPFQLPAEEEISVGRQGHIISAQKNHTRKMPNDILQWSSTQENYLGYYASRDQYYAAQHPHTHLLIISLPDPKSEVWPTFSQSAYSKPQGHSDWVKNGLHAPKQINETHIWNFSEVERRTFSPGW